MQGNSRGSNHEFLEGQATTGVSTIRVSIRFLAITEYDSPAVEDVHEGNGEDIWLLGPGKIRDMGVERNALLSVSKASLV